MSSFPVTMDIITTDNNLNSPFVLCGEEAQKVWEDLKCIAGKSIGKLSSDGLWLFPDSVCGRYDDGIENNPIFTIEAVDNDRISLKTGNIMGFAGCGSTRLTIRSRFSQSNGNDWFMLYMLQKVFSINVFALDHSRSQDYALDIAAMLFPYFLKKAMDQGVYREYVHRGYNDSRARGFIDFNAHIRYNYPFRNGKISYRTCEYVYDNTVTQLIRHTIEHLQRKTIFGGVLKPPETQKQVKQIKMATPTYRRSDLRKVMLANTKPKIHPYYSEYRPLQRLCLQILHHERFGYGDTDENIHGILFDGAWLWEEYLNITLSKAGFAHPRNKTGEGRYYPFKENRKNEMYPDFYYPKNGAENGGRIDLVADAKYKRLNTIERNDLFQMISYMHVMASNRGILICPSALSDTDVDGIVSQPFVSKEQYGTLKGKGGEIFICRVNIPKTDDYAGFVRAMGQIEEEIVALVKKT